MGVIVKEQLQSILNELQSYVGGESDPVGVFLEQPSKFENWIQVEFCRLLAKRFKQPEYVLEVEKNFDILLRTGDQILCVIEMKMFSSSTREQVVLKSKKDICKLLGLPLILRVELKKEGWSEWCMNVDGPKWEAEAVKKEYFINEFIHKSSVGPYRERENLESSGVIEKRTLYVWQKDQNENKKVEKLFFCFVIGNIKPEKRLLDAVEWRSCLQGISEFIGSEQGEKKFEMFHPTSSKDSRFWMDCFYFS